MNALETAVHGFQTFEGSSPLLSAAIAQVRNETAVTGPRGRWEVRRGDWANPCAPSAVCAAEVRAWAFDKQTDNGVFFWVQNNGGLKTLTKHLRSVLSCPAYAPGLPLAFVDVGAGIYSGTLSTANFAELDAAADPHDSDALLLLALFQNRSVVHAFEMNPDKARQLEQAARLRPATRHVAGRLHVHQMGLGNTTTAQGRVVKCGDGRGYANTWRAMDSSQAPPSADCDIGGSFRLTTLDDFARDHATPSFLYVKVDVEGGA